MLDCPSAGCWNPHDLSGHVKGVFTADALHMLWNKNPSMEKLGVLLISRPSPITREGALIGEVHYDKYNCTFKLRK